MAEMETQNRLVQILAGPVELEGSLSIPDGAEGIVVFVHGSGSSRHSPRNQAVAQELQSAGLATLLFDLLTAEEEQVDLRTRHLRFDIDLLARRTIASVDWAARYPETSGLQVGLFGSSTGAAAALIASTQRETVRAVVSRGGRPDLAGPALAEVKAPTLLLVGGNDDVVIDLNEQALAQMPPQPEKKLVIIPGASHLFEEPGALEQVFRYASQWFQKYLSIGAPSR